MDQAYFLLPLHFLRHSHNSINQDYTVLLTVLIKTEKTNHMKRPHHARHWGTNDHKIARVFRAACFHLCFPSRQCMSLAILLQKEASCKHPVPVWSIPLQAVSRPLAPPSSLPTPWGSIETGCQKLFSQHCGPFHTTGIVPSFHLIKVTPAYLYLCPSWSH